MDQQRYAIVVAAGTGKRMGAPLPKQYLVVGGKPLVIHTLERLHAFDKRMRLILVLHPDFIQYWNTLVSEFECKLPLQVVAGGEERFHSVKCALDVIQDENVIVGIHDAVRPLVSLETLSRCYESAATIGNAIPVIPVNDSLREVEEEGNRAVDRSRYRIVQTPQCFRIDMLRDAFSQSYQPFFTDDASVVESAGYSIHLVEGNRENIKITTPEDLRRAEMALGV